MEACLVYEKDKTTGYEYWKERKTGKVFRFRNGRYQELFDSKGNLVTIENGSEKVNFRYCKNNKISFEYYVFIDSTTNKTNEYKRWYSYDEDGRIMSITDSYGNKELYDEDGIPFYSFHGKPFTHSLLLA